MTTDLIMPVKVRTPTTLFFLYWFYRVHFEPIQISLLLELSDLYCKNSVTGVGGFHAERYLK